MRGWNDLLFYQYEDLPDTRRTIVIKVDIHVRRSRTQFCLLVYLFTYVYDLNCFFISWDKQCRIKGRDIKISSFLSTPLDTSPIITKTKFMFLILQKHCGHLWGITLHKKWISLSRISSVNVTNTAVSCRFGHIYWRNP